jgi:hypothetical protein
VRPTADFVLLIPIPASNNAVDHSQAQLFELILALFDAVDIVSTHEAKIRKLA